MSGQGLRGAHEAPTAPAGNDFLDGLDRGDVEFIASLVQDLAPLAPKTALRGQILDATQAPGRLHRFAEKLAALVDVSLEKAKELLDRVADPSRWEKDLFPGLDALWVEGGPAAAQCIRGFARLKAGELFPQHRHIGSETTLVLEGAMLESGGTVVRPGETLVMDADSQHEYRAASGGTDLLFFVVVREGLGFEGGGTLMYRD